MHTCLYACAPTSTRQLLVHCPRPSHNMLKNTLSPMPLPGFYSFTSAGEPRKGEPGGVCAEIDLGEPVLDRALFH